MIYSNLLSALSTFITHGLQAQHPPYKGLWLTQICAAARRLKDGSVSKKGWTRRLTMTGLYFPSSHSRTVHTCTTRHYHDCLSSDAKPLTLACRSTEDFSYFTLVHKSQPPRSLFGISCTRQLDSSQLINRPKDVTRSTVQKAVVVITESPQTFSAVREKLSVVTRAWFAQK